jgi:chemotaxis protein histidine kinase CheA
MEKFEYLKKTYGKKPDLSKLTEDFAAQITMTDDDCHGIFYVAYLNSVLAMEPYDYRDNTVAINVNSGLLEEILKGKKDPVEAYNNGELQAWGNLGHALMMIGALKKEPAKRKPAAKKTAKKAAEKAEKAVKEVKEEVKEAAPKAKKAAEKVEKAAEKTVETVKEAKKEAAPKAKKAAEKVEKAAEKAVETVKEAKKEAAPKAKKAAAKAKKEDK